MAAPARRVYLEHLEAQEQAQDANESAKSKEEANRLTTEAGA